MASRAGKPIIAWFIGLIIVVAVEVYLAATFFGSACSAPVLAQLMVLLAIPGVYLTLMYMTLKR